MECWRIDSDAKKYCEQEFENVNFRIYPSLGNKYFGIYSYKFLKDLRNIKERVILNVQAVHKPLLYHILLFRKNNFIMTVQHHGNDYSPYFNIKYGSLLKKLLSLLYLIPEALLIKRIDFFFLIDIDYIKYLKKSYINLNEDKYIIQPVGIDTSSFQPLNKSEAKKLLGLDEEKKYLFYVGKYDQFKEVDKLVEIFKNVKKNCPDLQLMTAGGSRDDIFYNKIIDSGAIELGPVMNNELYKYFSAADIYTCCSFRYDYFGGIGIAMLEALACNTPVVSKSLENIPEDKQVLCGKKSGNENEMTKDIKEILNTPDKYDNTRKVVESLYDFKVIQSKMRDVYDRLYNS